MSKKSVKGNFIVAILPNASYKTLEQATRYAEMAYIAQQGQKNVGVGIFQIEDESTLKLKIIYSQERGPK